MSFEPARVVLLVPVVVVFRGECSFDNYEGFDYKIGVAEY